MDLTKQRQILWSALPELLISQGEKTGPSRSRDLLSEDQIAEWKTFENEVREDTKAKNGNPEQALISPPTVDSYVVATEDGIQARFIEQVCSEIGKVFEAQGISVRFADRSTGQHAITGHNPDVIIQGSSQDGTTKVAGEMKTPWTTTLMSMDSKSIRRVLGR